MTKKNTDRSTDTHEIPYAKLGDIQVGDTIEVDDEFEGIEPWSKHTVIERFDELCIEVDNRWTKLADNIEDTPAGKVYVGIYGPMAVEAAPIEETVNVADNG